jgi:hypothetical protein
MLTKRGTIETGVDTGFIIVVVHEEEVKMVLLPHIKSEASDRPAKR